LRNEQYDERREGRLATEATDIKSRAADREPAAVDPIEALRAENAELKDRVLRTIAEMENLRKRTERERRRYAQLRHCRLCPRHADRHRCAEPRPDGAAGRSARTCSMRPPSR
jgi:predicted RNase H-like nuclease (RuvC/YqgF family)